MYDVSTSDQLVELGGVVGLDLPLPVVGGGQHHLHRTTEFENSPGEDLIGSSRQAGHADKLVIAGQGRPQLVGDTSCRSLRKRRMPGDTDTWQPEFLS
jgi:hypothetical protein